MSNPVDSELCPVCELHIGGIDEHVNGRMCAACCTDAACTTTTDSVWWLGESPADVDADNRLFIGGLIVASLHDATERANVYRVAAAVAEHYDAPGVAVVCDVAVAVFHARRALGYDDSADYLQRSDVPGPR